ncbi:MAG TPA: EAL domain-containing protein [Albitalea sp.]|nr:EAL domain-containing protein [Albitalea sp.]
MKRLRAPLGRAAHWMRASIGARVIALFLGLLLIVQVASFTALQASLARHARGVLPDKLQVGARVLQNLLDRQAQTLSEGARLLAADYGFREAVSSNDRDTIVSVLANHGARIGATEAALISTSFELRATTSPDPLELSALVAHLSTAALSNGRATQIALLSGRPHQVVMVPIKAPLTVGWVLMGVPLDDGLARDMRSLSDFNVTLLADASGTDAWTAAVSSLPVQQTAGLAAQHWTALRVPARGTQSIPLAGEEFCLYPVWLGPPAGPGQASPVLAVVSLSVDEAVRLPRDLQFALLAVTLLGFIAFGVFGVLTAGRVTTPLRRLSAAADRLGAGDYSTPVTTGVRRDDELGHLAQAFEQMRVSVADKQAQILKLAYWDSLTGLPNRMQFRDAVRDAIGEAQALGDVGTVSVIMLDLDRFKHVNDVLGYRFGDLLLCRVAERLSQQSVRGADLVARLGGDEFAVLLRDGDLELARAVAQRIERAFDVPLVLEEHTVDMGAGIGLACWPQHAGDADLLLSRAEVAMYSAKRRTSGPLVYDPSIDLSSAQTLSLLSELRQALGEGQLRLYLQPKLALDSGNVVGAETLVRWQHPQRGLVPPMQFIPFAEQTGFIRTITLWVFEEAARHWRMLHAEGTNITLSVNLSTRDLLDPELPQKFDMLLVKHRVPAEGFCLEITESAIMDDPQRAQATLERLSALGFKLSIDDFGTGYSSLAYLKRLPVDELKIDKSFVLSMESDADDAKIVRSTIDLAHNLGLTVVAEGVENATVWSMLRELNCDQAQGFHMGRPMAATEFTTWSTGWLARQRNSEPQARTLLH